MTAPDAAPAPVLDAPAPEVLAALAARLSAAVSYPGGIVDHGGTFRADVAAAAAALHAIAATAS